MIPLFRIERKTSETEAVAQGGSPITSFPAAEQLNEHSTAHLSGQVSQQPGQHLKPVASNQEELEPLTFKWLASLPSSIRPERLPRAFPRIANQLARLATRPQLYGMYLDELLVDRRGGRRGFPVDVHADLETLQSHFWKSQKRW